MFKKPVFYIFVIFCLFAIAISSFGRANFDPNDGKGFNNYSAADNPAYEIVGHRIGKLELGVNNNGTFGTGFARSTQDAITGQPVASCEFPRNSNLDYLFAGAFWIGAVVERDTLVSVAADGWSGTTEFLPDIEPFGKIKKKSLLYPDIDSLYIGAVSEEDYIMQYRDTGTVGVAADYFGRPHRPLNIEVTQKSYAWSYAYSEDFVLFDYEIKNIGVDELRNVYMGIYVDGDVGSSVGPDAGNRHTDDISGFRETTRTVYKDSVWIDTVNIAWLADNDGDPLATNWDTKNSIRGVTGTKIIRTPAEELEVSFNWWVSDGDANKDYGPREKGNVGKLKEEFRDLRTGGLGTPEGDVNKYYFMRNREFDYDQFRISEITTEDSLWLKPDDNLVEAWATGLDTRYLLSFGPFTINPGEKLPLSFAYVAGDEFHTNTTNLENLREPGIDINAFENNLNFDDLGYNAAWADRVYDNPGVDTDGDGYFGEYRVYENILSDGNGGTIVTLDTLWYRGDGVPDFRGASPPPAPTFFLIPDEGQITVRFNGKLSETSKDAFSNINDFEGYRVYYSLDELEASYSLLQSYDKENYNIYVYNGSNYTLTGNPLDLVTIQDSLADSSRTFDPLLYSRSNPYFYNSQSLYFEPNDYNASTEGVSTDIRKVYPSQPYPSSLSEDSVDVSELTPEGKLKYFEYEIVIRDLLPSIPYYVNVTAFDFGSRIEGQEIAPLESKISNGAKLAYAQPNAQTVLDNDLKVFCYPNPYRIDAEYSDFGYERADEFGNVASDRIRAIHFANLPPKCTIKIYSLDGDLIREIIHDKPADDPTSGTAEWNLITRNTQLIVSGLYYWVVESEFGETQIGKLVIIM